MKPIPLEIKLAGEPVLRQTARKLTREEILSPTTQHVIEQMRETMYKAPGVGVAAPQIGLGFQLAVIEDKAEYMKDIAPEVLIARERSPVPFQVIINPVLTLETASRHRLLRRLPQPPRLDRAGAPRDPRSRRLPRSQARA